MSLRSFILSTAPSPPLALAQSSQPYFLHRTLPSSRSAFCNAQPLVDLRSQRHVGADEERGRAAGSACVHKDESIFGCDDSLADLSADVSCYYGDGFRENSPLAYGCISDPQTNKGDFLSESFCNFDSLYSSGSEKRGDSLTEPPAGFRGPSQGPGSTTPYKNIDVMMMYSDSVGAVDSLISDCNATRARTYKELPPLPVYYLYSPKDCPLHRGAPPRLSPIGALSPPRRSGGGAMGSRLNSPLSPRSHTLPALAAPLYYPNLYPPIPPRPPPLPPKLYQGPLQSHVASKISLFLFSHLHLNILSLCLCVSLSH